MERKAGGADIKEELLKQQKEDADKEFKEAPKATKKANVVSGKSLSNNANKQMS